MPSLMTEEMHSTLPIVRSRSSVVSTPSYIIGATEHSYSLRSRGPVHVS